MEEFTKKLTALRMGAKKAGGAAKSVAKGTLANMKRGLDGTAAKEMDQARKDRDQKMIRENFGNEENYRKTFEGSEDLFTPPYQKAGKAIGKGLKSAKGFFDRLVSVRGGGK